MSFARQNGLPVLQNFKINDAKKKKRNETSETMSQTADGRCAVCRDHEKIEIYSICKIECLIDDEFLFIFSLILILYFSFSLRFDAFHLILLLGMYELLVCVYLKFTSFPRNLILSVGVCRSIGRSVGERGHT